MKLTLVIVEMIMGKEVDVKVDWEVDDVGEDVPSLGKTSLENEGFNSGIARKWGGVYPCPNFLVLFSTK